jgi:twinkle protein
MGEFVGHEACPECGSSNNLARYDDGSAYCFGCKHHEHPSASPQGGFSLSSTGGHRPMSNTDLVQGVYQDLPSRGLREETLKKFRYQLGSINGMPVQIANYCGRSGSVVAQKIRKPGKEFSWSGDPRTVFNLFGQDLWGPGGRKVIVTEGEIDCMSVSQIQDNKWPVVSVPDGASSSSKAILRSSDWLETFDQVIFMFDGDTPGREGARECAALLTPGKAFIADLPDGEDPNSLLVAHNSQAITAAMWGAKPYRPDSVASLAALLDEAVRPVEWGFSLPTCLATLYRMSYGPKPGSVWVGGAGVGIGKTDVFTEMEAHDLEQGRAIAVWHGEQAPHDTPKRIAAKMVGKPFFKPDCEYTEEELRDILGKYEDKLHIYDHRKLPTDWPELSRWIRWVVKVYGVQCVYLDNLTLLSADADDERRYLDGLLAEAVKLASQLNIVIHFLSHLTTPQTGKSHEEGGRVEAKQFTGSRAIMRYASYMWGLERDTQAEDMVVRTTSTFRCIKDRLTGQSTGQTFWLRYDPLTSLQEECEAPPEPEKKGEDYGFKPQQSDGYNFS